MTWRTVAAGAIVYIFHKDPVSDCFFRGSRCTGFSCGIVMCIIMYNSLSHIVTKKSVWVLYIRFIQIILVQFLRKVEVMFFQQNAIRLPQILHQFSWHKSHRVSTQSRCTLVYGIGLDCVSSIFCHQR